MNLKIFLVIIGVITYANAIAEFMTNTPWSGTLPVMHINTANNSPITSKEIYIEATYWLDPMGKEEIEPIGSIDKQELLQIRGRGNYTWQEFNKKPYRIKLAKKTPLLGMDSSKHFALLAHADDSAAGLRNALGFAASETLGMPWTPATQPLEVVLNGDYIGLYWLTETVRVDNNRVNVREQADLASEDVDGGWLVEIDNYDSDPHVTVNGNSGQIWFTYKSPEVLSWEQESYLKGAMQAIQDALAAINEEEAMRLVDFDVLARYFITNQLMLDMESFHGSCYLNRQWGISEKWKFGPVWDFGYAFSLDKGNNPRFIFDNPEFSQHWVQQFYAMSGFVETVRRIWNSFIEEGGPKLLESKLGYRLEQIKEAVVKDSLRWPEYDHTDIEWQADRLNRWLLNSVEWLNNQWGGFTEVDNVPMDGIMLKVNGKKLEIKANRVLDLAIYRLDGFVRNVTVKTEYQIINLEPGFYIVGNKKIII